MNIPQDLKVHFRDGLLELWSGNLVVTVNLTKYPESSLFRNGPVTWEFLQQVLLEPALAQFAIEREAEPVA